MMSDAQNEMTGQTMTDIAGTIQGQQSEQSGNQSQQDQGSTDNVSDFKQFIDSQSKVTQDLSSKLEQTTTQLNELVNGQRRESVNKEIKSAAQKINDNVGGNEDLAELFLEKQYRENPDFQKIWQNREANPEAYQKALDVLSPEWATLANTTIDPQVSENQRALAESQRNNAGKINTPSLDEKLANMDNATFMKTMRQLQG